jgi:hypothetical protein
MTNPKNRKQSAILLVVLGAIALTGCSHQQATLAPGHTGTSPMNSEEKAEGLAKLQSQTQSQQASQTQARQQELSSGLAKLQSQSQGH